MQVVVTDAEMLEIAAIVTDRLVGTSYGGIILYTDDLSPTKNTALADLTQPVFTGYAPAVALKNPVMRNPDGSWSQDISPVSFVVSNPPPDPAVICHGWACVDEVGAPTAIQGAGRFDAPVSFAEVGDGITLFIQSKGSQTDGTTIELTTEAVLL